MIAKSKRLIGSTFCATLLLIGALTIVASDSSSAAQAGDYSYTVNGGFATITGYNGTGGVITIPSTLGGYAVVAIGDSAFLRCTSLTAVSIPNGVVSIGEGAFADCTSLVSFTIPNSVTSIGFNSFYNCTNLLSVAIPDSVTYLGDAAFWQCSSLTSVTIPESVTAIGNETFWDCSALTLIIIPDNATSIGYDAFQNCISLTSINIPSKVTYIGWNAFFHCTALTSVTLPDSVTYIGYDAFYECTSLISMTIPSSVAYIGGYAFYDCSKLSAIDVDAANPVYTSIEGVLCDKTVTTLIQCPAGKTGAFTIPSNVANIEDSAFSNCIYLTSISIPKDITSIGILVFSRCVSLTSITIPSNVTSIGVRAFTGCTNLTSITFLGLVAPNDVGFKWIEGTPIGIRGHALPASNFPAPGGDFNGLTMGSVIAIPGVPAGLTAIGGNAQTILTWTAPPDNGGPITSYHIYRSFTDTGNFVLIASTSSLTYTDTNLTNSRPYWYKVSAINAVGEGVMSPATSVHIPQPVSPAINYAILILMMAAFAITVVLLVAVVLVLAKRKGEK